MEKIEFDAGNEDKFLEFAKNISDSDRIGIISHVADADGIVSAKVVGSFVKSDYMTFINYSDLNDNFIQELKEQNLNKLIFTDLSTEQSLDFFIKLGDNFKVLWIDHHLFKNDINSDNLIFMNAQGYCAAYLSYYLFSKIKDLNRLDWIVAVACVSDFATSKNSEWMDNVFTKYGAKFINSIDGREQGKFWNLVDDLGLSIIALRPNVKVIYDNIGEDFGNLGDLRNYIDPIRESIKENLEKFENHKIIFNEGYLFEIESKYPIKSYISNALSVREINKTFIIFQKRDNKYDISVRRQDGKVDTDKLAKELIKDFVGANAGGHFKASGGYFPVKYFEEFKKRLENL